MRDFWHDTDDAITPQKLSWQFDPQTATIHLTMDGTFQQDWHFEEQDDDAWLRLEPTRVARQRDFSRTPGLRDDAPYALSFPSYFTFSLDYALPGGGRDIHFYGNDVSQSTKYGAWNRTGVIKSGVSMSRGHESRWRPKFRAIRHRRWQIYCVSCPRIRS